MFAKGPQSWEKNTFQHGLSGLIIKQGVLMLACCFAKLAALQREES